MFVAGFIGSPAMNFLPGRIEPEGPPTFVGDGGIEVSLPDTPAITGSRNVVLGIRSEHFATADDGFPMESFCRCTNGLGNPAAPALPRLHDCPRTSGANSATGRRDRSRQNPDPRFLHLFDANTGSTLFGWWAATIINGPLGHCPKRPSSPHRGSGGAPAAVAGRTSLRRLQ